jgi:homoaconitate hydratase family protein
MSMTVTEKIIARHAGKNDVSPGDLVIVDVDLACIDDVQFMIFHDRFNRLGGQIRNPERVLVIADHYLPPSGVDEAQVVWSLAQFGRSRGLRTLLRDGIKHPVFIEKRMAIPGSILVATDSHTNTAGSVAALAVALGPSDVAAVFATGKTWMRVPATIRFELSGELPAAVLPMDVGLSLLGHYGREFANYRSIEWVGDTIERMRLPGRMTLCNLTTEFGAKNGIVPADAITKEYATDMEDEAVFLRSDSGARYEAVYKHDANDFRPVVAVPPNPSNVYPVEELGGTKVDQAYIGSCTHGTLEDLHLAASVLRGRTVHPRVRLIVTPATQQAYEAAIADGTMAVFAAAGGTITSPGCGSCPGVHEGTLADGEVRISTQNRNFVGRSGHPGSNVYLASPLTVAAAAIAGEIVDPRDVA